MHIFYHLRNLISSFLFKYVEYMYTFVGCGDSRANVAIRVADNDRAASLLADAGYTLVSD